MLPYLTVKRYDASILLEFIDLMYVNNQGAGRPLSKRVVARREKLFSLMIEQRKL